MEFNIRDLSKEKLSDLKRKLLTVCGEYEPWADMMLLSGAGDPGVDHFPLDLEEIESIDITMVGSQDPITGSPKVQWAQFPL